MPAPAAKKLLALFILLLPACAGSLGTAKTSGHVERAASSNMLVRPAPPSLRCTLLDDRHAFWSSVGQGSGLLAGASGISMLPVDDKNGRIALGVGSLVTGALAAFAVSMSSGATESWAKECAP